MTDKIYKICPADIWQKAQEIGHFSGAGIDLVDGYIHFSTAEQVAQTAHLHFNGQRGLWLIEIETKTLPLKWEESRGGQLFPHLYDDLSMQAVTQIWPMDLDDEGNHILPDMITPLSHS